MTGERSKLKTAETHNIKRSSMRLIFPKSPSVGILMMRQTKAGGVNYRESLLPFASASIPWRISSTNPLCLSSVASAFSASTSANN